MIQQSLELLLWMKKNVYYITIMPGDDPGVLLLTWINFYPSMDK